MAENRRVRLTKQLMKDAFLELLEKKTLEKISVTDICTGAEVNRSTFYVYYEDTSQLLMDMENDALGHFDAPENDSVPDSDEAFLNRLEAFFRYVRENKRLFKILLLKTGSNDFVERLIALVTESYHRQTGSDDPLLDRYGYLFSLHGGVGVLKAWISEDFPLSDRLFARTLLRMSLNANRMTGERQT